MPINHTTMDAMGRDLEAQAVYDRALADAYAAWDLTVARAFVNAATSAGRTWWKAYEAAYAARLRAAPGKEHHDKVP